MFMISRFQSPVKTRIDLRVSNTGQLHKHRQTSHKLDNALPNFHKTLRRQIPKNYYSKQVLDENYNKLNV